MRKEEIKVLVRGQEIFQYGEIADSGFRAILQEIFVLVGLILRSGLF